MHEPTKEQEYTDEAARLAMLPAEDQAEVIRLYSDLAKSPLATPACRKEAGQHAKALKRHLGRLKESRNNL